MILLKECKRCKKTKPIAEFVKHPNYKDGYTNICKVCSDEKYHGSFRREVLERLQRIEDKLK